MIGNGRQRPNGQHVITTEIGLRRIALQKATDMEMSRIPGMCPPRSV